MKGLVRGEYHCKWLARTVITSMLREAGIQNEGLKRKKKEEKHFHSVLFFFPRPRFGKYQVTPSGYMCVLCSSTLLQFSHRLTLILLTWRIR